MQLKLFRMSIFSGEFQPLPRIINLSYTWIGVLPEGEEFLAVFNRNKSLTFFLYFICLPSIIRPNNQAFHRGTLGGEQQKGQPAKNPSPSNVGSTVISGNFLPARIRSILPSILSKPVFYRLGKIPGFDLEYSASRALLPPNGFYKARSPFL